MILTGPCVSSSLLRSGEEEAQATVDCISGGQYPPKGEKAKWDRKKKKWTSIVGLASLGSFTLEVTILEKERGLGLGVNAKECMAK